MPIQATMRDGSYLVPSSLLRGLRRLHHQLDVEVWQAMSTLCSILQRLQNGKAKMKVLRTERGRECFNSIRNSSEVHLDVITKV